MNIDIGPDTFVLKGPEYRRFLAAENEIARLHAENEQLRAAIQAAVDTHEGRRMEVARLREALKKIAGCNGWEAAEQAVNVAREGFAAGIEAAAKTVEVKAGDNWCRPSTWSGLYEKEVLAREIRALRPPAETAESAMMRRQIVRANEAVKDELHNQAILSSSEPAAAPLTADDVVLYDDFGAVMGSEYPVTQPAGPSEEDVARLICKQRGYDKNQTGR